MNERHLVRTPILFNSLLAIGLVISIAGCSDSSDDPPPAGTPSTTFTGAMINGSENGRLSVSIATTTLAPQGSAILRATVVSASATYRPIGGAMVTLNGTYDTDTDSLSLAGGGYAISAFVEVDPPASMVGQYSGPNGPGFFGAISNAAGALSVFCGTYQSSSTSEMGNLAMLLNATEIAGVAFPSTGGDPLTFEGTLTGTGATRTISATGGEPGVFELTIDGTYNTTTGQSSGTWTVTDVAGGGGMDSGTWSAGPCP